jgi:hypothetical protein
MPCISLTRPSTAVPSDAIICPLPPSTATITPFPRTLPYTRRFKNLFPSCKNFFKHEIVFLLNLEHQLCAPHGRGPDAYTQDAVAHLIIAAVFSVSIVVLVLNQEHHQQPPDSLRSRVLVTNPKSPATGTKPSKAPAREPVTAGGSSALKLIPFPGRNPRGLYPGGLLKAFGRTSKGL